MLTPIRRDLRVLPNFPPGVAGFSRRADRPAAHIPGPTNKPSDQVKPIQATEFTIGCVHGSRSQRQQRSSCVGRMGSRG